MNVFELDRALVSDYERFARSFTQIRAPDIRSQVEEIYATNRFWPEPLISINPNFERGASVPILQPTRPFTPTLHGSSASLLPAVTAEKGWVEPRFLVAVRRANVTLAFRSFNLVYISK